MWAKRKKQLSIAIAVIVLLAGVLITAYFCFRSSQTMADIVGRSFMEPEQLMVLNGSTGNRREITGSDREEMLSLLYKAEVQDTERIDGLTNGFAGCIEFIRGDNCFTLTADGDYSFRTYDPDHEDKMILYHLEEKNGKKISDLMERYY